MGRGLMVAFGVARHEIIFQARTKLLFGGVVLAVVFTLLLGYITGLQARRIRHIPVGLYQEEGILRTAALADNEDMLVTQFPTSEALLEAVRNGTVIGGLIVQSREGGGRRDLRVVLDDAEGVLARAAGAAITREVVRRSFGAAAGLLDLADEPIAVRGLDMSSEAYPLQVMSPGFLPVTILMSGLGILGFLLIRERSGGTIYELAMAPVHRIWIVLGKLAASTIILFIQLALVTLLVVYLFQVRITGSLWALGLVCLSTAVGFIGLALAASALFRSELSFRLVLGLPVMYPMMMLSGITYPVRGMPEALQRIASVLPLTWTTSAIRDVFFRGAGVGDVAGELWKLSIFSLVMIVAGGLLVGRLMQGR
ncbi:MAG: ABC transporter permease [Deinococcus sp.]|nr:ABC transporter permease [Deinococcus sp.]